MQPITRCLLVASWAPVTQARKSDSIGGLSAPDYAFPKRHLGTSAGVRGRTRN
jgi:hypothetical protein